MRLNKPASPKLFLSEHFITAAGNKTKKDTDEHLRVTRILTESVNRRAKYCGLSAPVSPYEWDGRSNNITDLSYKILKDQKSILNILPCFSSKQNIQISQAYMKPLSLDFHIDQRYTLTRKPHMKEKSVYIVLII